MTSVQDIGSDVDSASNDAVALRVGDLEIDSQSRSVTVAGQEIALTGTEYALLSTLASQPGKAFSSEELLHAMSQSDWVGDTRVLHVHASRLRHKLGDSGSSQRHIQTVHGYGYRLNSRRGSTSGSATSPAYVVAGLDRIIQWASPQVDGLLGHRPTSLVGRSLYDLIHPDRVSEALAAKQDLDSGTSAMLVLPMLTGDGGYRLLTMLAHPIIGRDGHVTAFLGEMRPHAAGNDGENASPVDAASETPITLQFDRDLILIDMHPREAFLGWTPESILGTYFSPTGLDRETMQSVTADMLSSGVLETSGRVPVRTADGQTLAVSVLTTLHVNGAGEFDGYTSRVYPDGFRD